VIRYVADLRRETIRLEAHLSKETTRAGRFLTAAKIEVDAHSSWGLHFFKKVSDDRTG
jgi:hypothetical protein